MSIDVIIRKQLKIFQDRKKEPPADDFEWVPIDLTLIKKQRAKWQKWKSTNERINNDWSNFDRFQVRSQPDIILFRGDETGIYRCKGNLVGNVEVKPMITKDYSIARFKAFVDKKDDVKIGKIVEKLYNRDFNDPRVIDLAVESEIKLEPFQLVSLIGAPGTGKSTKMANIVERCFKTRKIVYFAPTHAQVMNFAEKLKAKGIKFVILSDESKIRENLILDHRSNIEKVSDKFKNTIPADAKVTLSTINKPIKFIYRAGIEVVLIDEASKVTVLEALTALYQIQNLKLLVVGGDDKQIGCEGDRFSKMTNILEFVDKRADVRFEVLKTYRLNSYSTYLTSEVFYEGKLRPSKVGSGSVAAIVIRREHSCDEKLACKKEASVVAAAAKLLGVSRTLVVTPYKDHLAHIIEMCPEVQVETVDSAQGREAENVIFTMGRSARRGFVTRNRINVATSRHTNHLVIVAHWQTMLDVPELKMIFSSVLKDNKLFQI